MGLVQVSEKEYIIKLDYDDDIIESIKDFAQKKAIKSAVFFGIGAVKSVHLGYFNISKRRYDFKEIPKNLEIVSLSGNVTKKGMETKVHAHIVVSDEEYNVFAGHLGSSSVSVTCEIYLKQFDEELTRKTDLSTGLDLIKT